MRRQRIRRQLQRREPAAGQFIRALCAPRRQHSLVMSLPGTNVLVRQLTAKVRGDQACDNPALIQPLT